MPSFHRIEELPTLAGHIVTTCGWVMTTRSSGKIGFVMLRDGTGYLQVVLSKKDVPEAAWEAFGGLTQETSEEHTSELQSRGHLVCRLLLEKKKKKYCTTYILL